MKLRVALLEAFSFLGLASYVLSYVTFFHNFYRHNGNQVIIAMGPKGNLVTLAEPTIGAIVTVKANRQYEIEARYKAPRAAVCCFTLTVGGFVRFFEYVDTVSSTLFLDYVKIMVLLPKFGEMTAEEWLKDKDFFNENVPFAEWLVKLSQNDAFAVVTFDYDRGGERVDRDRAAALLDDYVGVVKTKPTGEPRRITFKANL